MGNLGLGWRLGDWEGERATFYLLLQRIVWLVILKSARYYREWSWFRLIRIAQFLPLLKGAIGGNGMINILFNMNHSEGAPGTMALSPGFQLAGQTSPNSSTCWRALTSLRISSGFLPTGKSLMERCLKIPLGSMMQVALRAIPSSCPSSIRHPYFLAIFPPRSDNIGQLTAPNAPFSLLVDQAM